MGVLGQKLIISIRNHLIGKCLHMWFRWEKWRPLSEWISEHLTYAKDFLLMPIKHFGIHLCPCLLLFCWVWRLLLGLFFSFPWNALDHSSWICLQQYLLSLLTHWDLQLRCRVFVIIMVGKTLSATMSTAVHHCKLNAWLNTSRSLSFVPLGIVQGFAVLKKHGEIWYLPCKLKPYVSYPRQCDPQISPSPGQEEVSHLFLTL